jgi:hypothetical protein
MSLTVVSISDPVTFLGFYQREWLAIKKLEHDFRCFLSYESNKLKDQNKHKELFK